MLTAMTKSFLSDHFTDKSEVYYLFTDLYLRNIVRSHWKLWGGLVQTKETKQKDWPKQSF